jgi:ribosomal protein S27AE
MSDSPAQSPCPRCGQALSTTVSGSRVADQLASERISCANCGAGLVRVVDGHADRGWQLADVDA